MRGHLSIDAVAAYKVYSIDLIEGFVSKLGFTIQNEKSIFCLGLASVLAGECSNKLAVAQARRFIKKSKLDSEFDSTYHLAKNEPEGVLELIH